jgi:hypothetical protein
MRNTKSDLIPWFVALVLALGLAYWASIPVNDQGSTKVAVVRLKEASVASIELVADVGKVVATKASDASGRWWIAVDRSGDSARAEGTGDILKEKFIASEKFKDFVGDFSPLEAIRVVGKVSDDKLADYGLKDSKKTLLVKDSVGTQLIGLTIGKTLYGGRNVYALNQNDGTVVLLSGDLVTDFERPELRFFERSLTSFSPEDVRAAEVAVGDKSKRFTHSTKDAKGASVWTLDGGDGSQSAQFASWMEKMMQLKASAYASEADESTLSALPVSFEVRLDGQSTAGQLIQIKKRQINGTYEYWAFTSHLKWHVKVASTRAETLDKDVPKILEE